jgi:uncharacterized protein (TIGR02996 family)
MGEMAPSLLKGTTLMANNSPTADAFVQGVLEDPTDDACLVYADWLEERGDPLSAARAELVRVQCKLARWVPNRGERAALQERERGLIAGQAQKWLGPLHGLCEDFRFERGLAQLTLKARGFVGRAFAEASGQLQGAGVCAMRLQGVGKHLPSLTRAPHLASVPALDLSGNDLDDGALRTLLASPHLGRLARVDLRCNRLTDAAVGALIAKAPERLAWLDLRNNELTADGMRALLRSPLGDRLKGLELYAPDLGPDTVRDLVAWRSERDLAEQRDGLPVRLVNSLGMEFRLIPTGTFLMGSPESEPERNEDEGPQHEVEITRPFYLGAYPVTQREFQAVMGHNPSDFTPERGGGPLYPVENVSWEDGRAFCERLSAREPGRRYDLPTEAQWEHACRAGTETPFHFGNELNGTQANCRGNFPYGTELKGPRLGQTCRVGCYHANAFGLYDMHGNVWEWCADYYDPTFYNTSPSRNPFQGQKGAEERRVLRGGSWGGSAGNCRAAFRHWRDPADRNDFVGFRVALRLD